MACWASLESHGGQFERIKQLIIARPDIREESSLTPAQVFEISVASDYDEVKLKLNRKQIIRLHQLANQSALLTGKLVDAVRSTGIDLTKAEIRRLGDADTASVASVENELREIRIEIYKRAFADVASVDKFDEMIGQPFPFPVPYPQTTGRVSLLRHAQFAFPIDVRKSKPIYSGHR